MQFEASLQSYLKTACPSVAGRVTPIALAKDTPFPALTFKRIPPDRPIMAHDGPTGIVNATFEIVAWADGYTNAKATVDEVKGLTGFRGLMVDHQVYRVVVEDAQDGREPNINAARMSMRVSIQYRENEV